MGRLLSNQESSPLDRSEFERQEIERADEAKISGRGWITIEEVVFTDKGTIVTWMEPSEKKPRRTLEQSAPVDDVIALR